MRHSVLGRPGRADEIALSSASTLPVRQSRNGIHRSPALSSEHPVSAQQCPVALIGIRLAFAIATDQSAGVEPPRIDLVIIDQPAQQIANIPMGLNGGMNGATERFENVAFRLVTPFSVACHFCGMPDKKWLHRLFPASVWRSRASRQKASPSA